MCTKIQRKGKSKEREKYPCALPDHKALGIAGKNITDPEVIFL